METMLKIIIDYRKTYYKNHNTKYMYMYIAIQQFITKPDYHNYTGFILQNNNRLSHCKLSIITKPDNGQGDYIWAILM